MNYSLDILYLFEDVVGYRLNIFKGYTRICSCDIGVQNRNIVSEASIKLSHDSRDIQGSIINGCYVTDEESNCKEVETLEELKKIINKCENLSIYYVSSLCDSGELRDSKTILAPTKALEEWIKLSLKYPTMVAISCGSKEDCIMLYRTFLSNRERYKKYWDSGKMYIKYDYVVEACRKGIETNCKYFLGKEGFFDMIHPFCYG